MKNNSVKYGELKRVMFYLVVAFGFLVFTPSLAPDDSEASGLYFQNVAQGTNLEAISAYAQEKNLDKNLASIDLAQAKDKAVDLNKEQTTAAHDLIGNLYNYDKIANINEGLDKYIRK